MAEGKSWYIPYNSNLPMENPNYIHTNVDNLTTVIRDFTSDRSRFEDYKNRLEEDIVKRKVREEAFYKFLGASKEEFLEIYAPGGQANVKLLERKEETQKLIDAIFQEATDITSALKGQETTRIHKDTGHEYTQEELNKVVENAARVFNSTSKEEIEALQRELNIDAAKFSIEEMQEGLTNVQRMIKAKAREKTDKADRKQFTKLDDLSPFEISLLGPNIVALIRAIWGIRTTIIGLFGEVETNKYFLPSFSLDAEDFKTIGKEGGKADVVVEKLISTGSFDFKPGFSVKTTSKDVASSLKVNSPTSFNALLESVQDIKTANWIRYLFANLTILSMIGMGSGGDNYKPTVKNRGADGRAISTDGITDLLNVLTETEASIWLTGKLTDNSQADFFVVNTKKGAVLWPMSDLLIVIKNNLEAGSKKIISLAAIDTNMKAATGKVKEEYLSMYSNKIGKNVITGDPIEDGSEKVRGQMDIISEGIITTSGELVVMMNWKFLSDGLV